MSSTPLGRPVEPSYSACRRSLDDLEYQMTCTFPEIKAKEQMVKAAKAGLQWRAEV